MTCCVCNGRTRPRHRYCDRCYSFIRGDDDKLKRRVALREAYDRQHDGFRCHWSGVLLEEKDLADPFHLCFDHLYPVRRSRYVVSSELFNQMKTELTPDEFPRAISELMAHRKGLPFDRDFIEFSHWRLRAPSPPRPVQPSRRRRLTRAEMKPCDVCGRPRLGRSRYCARCRPFVVCRERDNRIHVRAMREAWNPAEDGFACHYTGARVDDMDPMSPWFLTFDHRVPGEAGTIVVAAWWVNLMKTALSEDEFWAVVAEYDKFLNRGGEFDRDVVEFKYWRRARRPKRPTHR